MAKRPQERYIRYYMEGTAAVKLEPIVPQNDPLNAPLPKVKKKVKVRRVYFDPVPILGIVVAVCMLFVMSAGMEELEAAQAEAAVMNRYVSYLTQENVRLSEEYAATYDLEEIEITARALGMVSAKSLPQTAIELPVIEEETPSFWDSLGNFFSGLFDTAE